MTHTVLLRPAILVAAALSVGACAGSGPSGSFSERDPYEETNRVIHNFNVTADRTFLRPVSQGYDAVTPALVQHLLGNSFDHFDTANDFANYMLQGEFRLAGRSFARFTINSIVGAAGLLDPATDFGLAKENTDFGVTLGKYGVEEGAYLVLPFFGPSTTRDLGGTAGDFVLSPETYIFNGLDSSALNFVSPGYNAVEIVQDRAANAELIDDVLYGSDDSYISLRTIYLQRRDRLIFGESEQLPDIFDEDAPSQ
ncbi:MAG: VacJ family lipoprotein [Paracoccaceae bacterium]